MTHLNNLSYRPNFSKYCEVDFFKAVDLDVFKGGTKHVQPWPNLFIWFSESDMAVGIVEQTISFKPTIVIKVHYLRKSWSSEELLFNFFTRLLSVYLSSMKRQTK